MSQTPVPPPPPAVTDYPVKAQNTTDTSSSLIQPIPISAVSAPHLVAGSVYQSGAAATAGGGAGGGIGGGGGEIPMEYGSVRMMSPQPQPSSLFMPMVSAPLRHQHSQVHRTLSLPSTLQQQRGMELMTVKNLLIEIMLP